MGDRATIEIQDNGRSVYLYTHWRGSEIKTILRSALARRQRWNDAAYLTRIIFSEMIKDDIAGETGFGISAFPCDGVEIVVNIGNQTVNTLSFEQFFRGKGK